MKNYNYALIQMNEKRENVRETFVTVGQLSMDSIPNDTKTNPRLRDNLSQRQDCIVQFPIHHDLRTILIEFKKVLKKNSYKCIDMCQKQILVIRLSLLDRTKKLFLCRQPPKFIITVNTHEFLSVREANIKALKSNSRFSFKETRPLELQQQVRKIHQILINIRSLTEQQSPELGELDGQYQQDFYSLDATSYYMFSRMLVDSNYSLGKKMKVVCQRFKSQSEIDRVSKEDLKWLNKALSQISRDLLQGFNCSRKQLLEILAYCRKSVEEYFYKRHYQQILNEGYCKVNECDRFPNQSKQIQRLVPATFKEILKLQVSTASMEIYRALFMIGLIFRAEIEVKALSEQSIGRSIFLIKQCFSGMINQKTRLLRCSGYIEQDYEQYISKFNFDHQVTF